jgi:hypothetical protein
MAKIIPKGPFVEIIHQICTNIFKGTDIKEKKMMSNYNLFLKLFICDPGLPIPYTYITDYVYKNPQFYIASKSEENHEIVSIETEINIENSSSEYNLKTVIDEVLEQIDLNIERLSSLTQDSNVQKVLDKIGRHIKLAITQADFIRRNYELIRTELVDTEIKVNETNARIAKTVQDVGSIQKSFNGLTDIKSKLYAEFVSILGIFTGIVIGIMGSLQTISSVFSHINKVSTDKLLVFSSLTAACIITILFLLMKWVSAIVSQNFDRIDSRNVPQILKDNVVFSTFMLILASAFVLGGALRYGGINTYLQSIFSNTTFSAVAVLLIPTLIVIIWFTVIIDHFFNKK